MAVDELLSQLGEEIFDQDEGQQLEHFFSQV